MQQRLTNKCLCKQGRAIHSAQKKLIMISNGILLTSDRKFPAWAIETSWSIKQFCKISAHQADRELDNFKEGLVVTIPIKVYQLLVHIPVSRSLSHQRLKLEKSYQWTETLAHHQHLLMKRFKAFRLLKKMKAQNLTKLIQFQIEVVSQNQLKTCNFCSKRSNTKSETRALI